MGRVGQRSRIAFAAGAIAVAVTVAGAANAQSNDATGAKKTVEEQEAQASFRADSNLVVIPVSVTDKLNRFVLGLRQTEFKILDDGVEQKIAHFSGEDVPLSIGLAFDTSGSMDYKMSAARDAAIHFLKTLTGGDEAFLAEFNDKVNLAAPFTRNMQEIQSAFQNVQPGGLTALLDAVKFSLIEMKKAKNSRKAIVMISDGGDNHSSYTPAQIEALVREADVEIYAMGVFDPLASIALTKEEVSGPRLLSEIATQTGGRAYAASVSSDLPSVASRIAIELRNQYVLGYYPANQKRDGKYHKVEVTVNQPATFPTLKLHWRQGYYAPSDRQ